MGYAAGSMPSETFDDAYYERFYLNPKTRVYGPDEHQHLAQYVFSFAAWNLIRIDKVLDVGAGIGLWRDWIEKQAPKVDYTGIEYSRAMCQQHGFTRADIATYRSKQRYDLIICQGVLQYLSDDDVLRALKNIARMSQGLVFFEALTQADLAERADQDRTDTHVRIRSGDFYREAFSKHFVSVGAGLYWPKDYELPFWELDVAGTQP